MDSDKEASKKVVKEKVKEKVKTGYENQNKLIPTKVVLKSLHTDILPATYEPVNIENFILSAKEIEFDVTKLIVETGSIAFDGKTNLANIKHESKIKNNTLLGDIVLTPSKELFKLYKIPVRKEAIGDIKIDLNASEEKVSAHLNAKAKQLLVVAEDLNSSDSNSTDENKTKPFNVDIDDLNSEVVFIVKSKVLNADTKIMISTPYAKNISVTNHFVMDKNISYSGAIKAAKVIGLDAKMVEALNDFMVKYDGSLNSVNTQISAEGLKGSFISSDMKKGLFHLETKEAIHVGSACDFTCRVECYTSQCIDRCTDQFC